MGFFLIFIVLFLVCACIVEIPAYLFIARMTMEQVYNVFLFNLISKVVAWLAAYLFFFALMRVMQNITIYWTLGAFAIVHVYMSRRILGSLTTLTDSKLWIICLLISTLTPALYGIFSVLLMSGGMH